MTNIKMMGLVIFLAILFTFGTGWGKNASPPLLLTAAPQLKRTTSPPVAKPTKQIVLKQPDLVINNMSWSFPLKQDYIVGQNSILNFTLKNQGTEPSGNFTIKFTCPNCPPSMTGTRTITSMAPGAIMGNNWPSPPAKTEKWAAGTYMIEAVIDPNRIIKDSNRTNNRQVLKFQVQGVPFSKKKLSVTKKKFLPTNPPHLTVGKRITSGFDFTTQSEPGTTGKRIVQGFNFSTIPEDGTTGIRTVSGFDFSTMPAPGTTGIRTVKGFDFSTQPMPGTTGKRTVQGFNFTIQ